LVNASRGIDKRSAIVGNYILFVFLFRVTAHYFKNKIIPNNFCSFVAALVAARII
jgi:hypothetical protein